VNTTFRTKHKKMTVKMDHKSKRKTSWDSKVSSIYMHLWIMSYCLHLSFFFLEFAFYGQEAVILGTYVCAKTRYNFLHPLIVLCMWTIVRHWEDTVWLPRDCRMDDFKKNFKEIWATIWNGLVGLKIVFTSELLLERWWASGFHYRQGISWVTERLLTYEASLRFSQLVSFS
jgi:hypothetical protein